MSSTIRNAVLAIAAAFAMVLPARAEEAAAPAVVARTEIRGLDALFAAVDRIAAPYVPAGQAKAMLTGASTAALGFNPFEVYAGEGTLRVLVYGTSDGIGSLFDVPAAGGDAAAAIGKLGTTDAPEGFDMPEGGRFLRTGSAANAGNLLVPRGGRLVVIDRSQPHPVAPAQAFELLDAAPPVPAGGVLAATVDFEAMLPLLAECKEGTTGARMRDVMSSPDFACRSVAFGIGLDEGDRFRTDFSVAYAPDAPQTRIVSGIGTPVSPLANAILFPDAVAASTYRQELSAFSDGEIRSFLLGENSYASIFGDDDPQAAALHDAMVAACIPFLRLLGDEYAVALLPADEGDSSASAALLAFPADPQAALDGLPDCFNGVISAFADAIRSVDDDVTDKVDALSRLRIEPVGERTVGETPVRRYVVRLEGEGESPARDYGAFEAAAAGPALYLGTLPAGRLGEVLADLAAGHTAKGPVAAMPSFAAAYGEAPDGAACGYVRLRPLLRAVLPAMRNLMRAMGADQIELKDLVNPVSFALSLDGHPYLPDITLASTQRWLPEGARLESVVSVPLADFHAAIDAISKAAIAIRTGIAGHAHPGRPGPAGGDGEAADGR